MRPKERHRIERVGWLRAAVLGANDGIVSTASLVLGVATAHASHNNIVIAGIAGLVAGAMSMAAGEYVSVHSQADTERAELQMEREELKADNQGEHNELAEIYVARGLDPTLAKQVAQQLMARDALGAHARDELGNYYNQHPTSNPSSIGFGCQLRGRSGAPIGCYRLRPGEDADLPGGRHVAGVFGAVGRDRRAGRGRKRRGGRHSRHVLGCAGYGNYCGRGAAVRNRCLSLTTIPVSHRLRRQLPARVSRHVPVPGARRRGRRR